MTLKKKLHAPKFGPADKFVSKTCGLVELISKVTSTNKTLISGDPGVCIFSFIIKGGFLPPSMDIGFQPM